MTFSLIESDKMLTLQDRLDIREYILNKSQLFRQPHRPITGRTEDNDVYFQMDLDQGRFGHLRGTWVAYKNGKWCGQSEDENKLRAMAYSHYRNGVSIFRIPD